MSEPRVRLSNFYEDTWLVGQDAQDMLDGAALRLLREALVEQSGPGMLCVDVTDELGRWYIAAYHADNVDGGDEGEGSTFAEAADACREALTALPHSCSDPECRHSCCEGPNKCREALVKESE